jgi:WD40 repeat protein
MRRHTIFTGASPHSAILRAAGSLLMSGSKDRTVQFWDPRAAATAARTVTLQGHDNSVISIAHSAADNRFATGSGDKKVWRYFVLVLVCSKSPGARHEFGATTNSYPETINSRHWIDNGNLESTE